MKSSIAKALIFTVGAAVGSAVTYILCRKAEMDHIQELTNSYEAEFRELSKNITPDIPDETVKAEETAADPTRVKPDTNKTGYSGFFKPDNSTSILGSSAMESLVREQSTPTEEPEGPVLIAQEAYEDNPWGYRQVRMLYYPQDDYICLEENEDQELAENSGYGHHWKVVGKENLEIFDKTDCDTIWVKSDAYRQLFEIDRCMGPAPIDDFWNEGCD